MGAAPWSFVLWPWFLVRPRSVVRPRVLGQVRQGRTRHQGPRTDQAPRTKSQGTTVKRESAPGRHEDRWRRSVTRRQALLSLAGVLAGSPLLRAQLDPRPLKDHRRVPGLEEMIDAFDFEPLCFANMTLRNYDYMAHGSDSEFTLRRNREAFQWVDLVERPGVSPDAVDTSTEVLGLKLKYPIFVAPSTRQRDLHPDGDSGKIGRASWRERGRRLGRDRRR